MDFTIHWLKLQWIREKPPGITPEKLAEWSVIGISFIITILAAWYIYHKMGKVRPLVLAEME